MKRISLIKKIQAIQIYDSRGNPSIESTVHTDHGCFTSSVPSGASTGIYEASELRDGGNQFHGKGVSKAINNVNTIINQGLQNMDVNDQYKIDYKMIQDLDGSKNEFGYTKSNLGANAVLSVSLAVSRAAAYSNNLQLFQYIQKLHNLGQRFISPVPTFNVINGGEHAGNDLPFQEFMLMPLGAKDFKQAMQMGSETYLHLKSLIKKKYGQNSINVGDEGGFAVNVNIESAFDLLQEAIHESKYQDQIHIACDVAASEFYQDGKYNIGYKLKSQDNKNILTKDQMIQFYVDLINKYKIVSIEDPFDQDDWESYSKLNKLVKNQCQIVGDDLLVTNKTRIQKAIDTDACNSLLLKVNQIGTLTESLEAVQLIQNNNMGVMTSHRSGETEDNYISDLAVGLSTGQIKTGAPCRGERTAKYNQLLRITNQIKEEYAGYNFRKPF